MSHARIKDTGQYHHINLFYTGLREKSTSCCLCFIEENVETVSQDANKLMLFVTTCLVNQDFLYFMKSKQNIMVNMILRRMGIIK
jgi:hypothetical protein